MAWHKSWRDRIDLARVSIVKHGKQAASTVHRVAAQGAGRAKMQGARLARHIIGVQKAAGASDRLMRESAKSVANRPMARESDRQWQEAYVAKAAQLVAGVKPPDPVPAGPSRPAWPHTAGPIDRSYFSGDPAEAPGEKADKEAGS